MMAKPKIVSLHDEDAEILSIARELIELDGQIASIRESRNEVKARLKAVGIKMKDFNYAYGMFKLEQMDEAVSLDGARACLKALLPEKYKQLIRQGDLFHGEPNSVA
jgi:hypothetical protein